MRCMWVLACAPLIISCQKDLSAKNQENVSLLDGQMGGKGEKGKNYYGASVKMGKGEARSFITMSKSGEPQELGIEMTGDAFDRLPEDHHNSAFILPLPGIAKEATAFDHIQVDWNAHGHAPFFYQLPHFDFHFYVSTLSERKAIPSYSANPAGFDNNPPAGYLPPTYIAPPGGEEAEMGKHWVDATSPELPWNAGDKFTKTFIYGSYDGKVTFLEPMVTLEHLQNGAESSTPIPQPSLYPKRTYYPHVFNVYKENKNKTYWVSLSSFALK